jgi:hypothetical protein
MLQVDVYKPAQVLRECQVVPIGFDPGFFGKLLLALITDL